MSIGPWEIIISFLVIIVLFGGKKIPELARGLGRGLREFKKAKQGITDEVNMVTDDVKQTVEHTE